MAKKKQKTEMITATKAAKMLASEGHEITHFHIGRLAGSGHLTKVINEKTGKAEYEWPKLLKDYETYLANRKQQQSKAMSKDVQIKADDAKNTWDTERIIKALEGGMSGSEAKALQWGKAVNELISVKKNQIALLELEGKTISREEVEDYIFRISRANRDVWLNWPQQIAASMAEELGVDGKLMNDVLTKFVRKNLERIATMPINLAGDRSE